MKLEFVLYLMFLIVSPISCSRLVNRKPSAQKSFNVVNYGAKGDGSTDDSNVYFYSKLIFLHAIIFTQVLSLFLMIQSFSNLIQFLNFYVKRLF